MMISVCILTMNSGRTLKKTLDSVREFSEVIILDNGSDDDTLVIAKQYSNVRIYKSPFIGFGNLRNRAAELATHDWIFALDSDEIVSSELFQELKDLQLSKDIAYQVPRHNYLHGKRIRGCGWNGERVGRLYNRKVVQFSPRQVHEALQADVWQKLSHPILHTPYRTTADFLSKMQHYSTLFAKEKQGKKRATFWIALGHGSFAFFRSFVFQKGFLCGTRGWIISFYNASTTFYKYLKLAEANKKSKNTALK